MSDNTQGDKYWTVTLTAFAFDTENQAIAFRDVLTDTFCAMPEAEGYGSSVSHKECILNQEETR